MDFVPNVGAISVAVDAILEHCHRHQVQCIHVVEIASSDPTCTAVLLLLHAHKRHTQHGDASSLYNRASAAGLPFVKAEPSSVPACHHQNAATTTQAFALPSDIANPFFFVALQNAAQIHAMFHPELRSIEVTSGGTFESFLWERCEGFLRARHAQLPSYGGKVPPRGLQQQPHVRVALLSGTPVLCRSVTRFYPDDGSDGIDCDGMLTMVRCIDGRPDVRGDPKALTPLVAAASEDQPVANPLSIPGMCIPSRCAGGAVAQRTEISSLSFPLARTRTANQSGGDGIVDAAGPLCFTLFISCHNGAELTSAVLSSVKSEATRLMSALRQSAPETFIGLSEDGGHRQDADAYALVAATAISNIVAASASPSFRADALALVGCAKGRHQTTVAAGPMLASDTDAIRAGLFALLQSAIPSCR